MTITRSVLALSIAILCAWPATAEQQDPGHGNEVATAIASGDFTGFQAVVVTWLGRKVPATLTDENIVALSADPVVANAVAQWQLIAKVGAANVAAFARVDANNKTFLAWLMGTTEAMDLYLLGAVPVKLRDREKNDYTIDAASLDIWNRIFHADPESRTGQYLRLAIATALRPPGTGNQGAGNALTPPEPLARYMHFKTAHKNKELCPSFDSLTVWEYQHIVSSGASDADLAWARVMINTFRPDLRKEEQVVNSTSMVWRRNAPEPFWRKGVGFDGTFRNVLAGGGKCGPRSSWAVMICQAFGIPAIGVGQPAHACVAYKTAYPMTEPQPGYVWKVHYGRGWEVSKLEGMSGPEFLAGIKERFDAARFSHVEHLRWLASALESKQQAAAVMDVAHKIQKAPSAEKADSGVKTAAKAGKSYNADTATAASKPTEPLKAKGGVLHVEAASFAQTGGHISWGGQVPHVLVHDCYTGGKQVYFQQQMKSQWTDYSIDLPASGTYDIVMKAAVINEDQVLEVCSGTNVIASVPIPLSYGLWQETKPVALKLEKGVQTVKIQTPTTEHKRGVAVRWFELRTK